MRKNRSYTEDDKAVALAYLAACGGNELKAARDCGVPRSTLKFWAAGGALNPAIVENSTQKKGDMADACEGIAWKLLAGMDDESKVADAALNTLSTAFGTMVDKMRLLRGESTNNVDVSDARTAVHQKWAALTATVSAEAVSEQPE